MTSLPTVQIPIDGVLDLHNFNPRDLKRLIPDYLAACQEQNISEIRIIHGKGTGALRDSVHAILRRQTQVKSFCLAPENRGSWGATLVYLISRETT